MAENDFLIKPELMQFAEDVIKKYDIDESHGIQHYINTVKYASIILDNCDDIEILSNHSKDKEREILLDTAFCHDLVDSKYISESEGIRQLEIVLRKWYNDTDINIIIHIITSISFSKRIRRKKIGLNMIESGPFSLAIGIIADADQLDGYDTERCRIYQEKKFGNNIQSDEERERLRRGWRKTILVNRVLKYKDHYMYTDLARKLAEPLHDIVIKHVADELEDAELFDYP